MADRTIDQVPADVPEFEGILEAVLLQALDEARGKFESGEELVPFTALAVGDTLFIETHPGNDADECFAAAQRTVQHARGASAYAFCYDGYVDTNDGELDAIIAEGGVPGASTGHAIGLLYTIEDGGEAAETAAGAEAEPGEAAAGATGAATAAADAASGADAESGSGGYAVKVSDQPLYIGMAPNFMEFTLFVDGEEFDGDNEVEGDGNAADEDGNSHDEREGDWSVDDEANDASDSDRDWSEAAIELDED